MEVSVSDNVADLRRTAWLESEGWRVLRFWNNDALANTDGVVEVILRALGTGTKQANRLKRIKD
jgi:very-short-patch-repair endonuclease